MFGLKIAIFRKNKGIKIEPVKEVQKPSEDAEYNKWKQAEEAKRRQQLGSFNRGLIAKYIDERVEAYVKWFKDNFPQPFDIGEEITYLYYNHQNPFAIGWHASPSSLERTFGAPLLGGPITFPVHKCFVSTEKLRDALHNKCDSWNYTEELTEAGAKNQVDNAWSLLDRYKRHNFHTEWVVDFDWETLKIPVENCANEEGWLNLRWGGFNAGYFITANRPMAKKQRKLYKKEKAYNDMKAQYEKDLEQIKVDFEQAKNSL